MSEEPQEETVEEAKPRKWWIGTSIAGCPSFLEIVSVNGDDVEEDAEKPPEFGADDDLVIDRGVFLTQMMGPSGPGQGFADIRQTFGPVLSPSDGDLSKRSSRIQLQIKSRSIMVGPYLWVEYGSPNYQMIWDQVIDLYKPMSEWHQQETKPVIAGADGQPINRPGAKDVLDQFGR